MVLRPERSGVVPVVRRSAALQVLDPSNKVIDLGPGGEAVVRVAQNFNAGWQAELDGTALDPLRVDGWQQGFVVPAGAGGTIHVVFEPDSAYRRALLVGGVVALLLVVGAAASAAADLRGRGRLIDVPTSRHASPGGPPAEWTARRRWRAGVLYAGFVTACVVLGGIAAVVGAAAWAWPWVRKQVGVVAGVALAVGALGQFLWVLTGGSAASPPVLVDLAVGASVTALVARSFRVPGPWNRAGASG